METGKKYVCKRNREEMTGRETGEIGVGKFALVKGIICTVCLKCMDNLVIVKSKPTVL